jgi:hypothetical protein
MNGIPGAREPGEHEPFDDVDASILADVHAFHALTDPPPADLTERVRFAIALEDVDLDGLDVVVSRLQDDLLVGSGARGAERTRTVTFDSDSLTIMVTIAEAATGGVRIDGWLAPSGPLRVELRITRERADSRGQCYTVTADDTGRFVFDGIIPGLAQIMVHPTPDSGVDLASRVVTPSLLL